MTRDITRPSATVRHALIPHLWFDDRAEEAARFYTNVFSDARILRTVRYPASLTAVSGKPAGSVMSVDFEIEGQRFVALNGGPAFTFSESVSMMIMCADQAEIDYYWRRLTEDGGEESMCGWLKDKFGFSWQVVHPRMDAMLDDADQRKIEAVTAAMLTMKKLDLAALEQAFASV